MERRVRPEIPKEKIIPVNNTKKTDFDKPFKFIYLDRWFYILTSPAVQLVRLPTYGTSAFMGPGAGGYGLRKRLNLSRNYAYISGTEKLRSPSHKFLFL